MILLRKSLSKLYFIFIILIFSSFLKAEDFQHEIGLGIHYYSGSADKSLAPNLSTALRFGAGNVPKSFYKWISSLTILSGSSTATFNDAGNSVSLSYTLLGGEFNFGFGIVPMAESTKLPVQPYFGVTGALQVTSLKFANTDQASATFPKTDANMYFGYGLLVGVDIQMGKSFGMGLTVEQSAVSGQVATKPFGLGGNRIFLNFLFR